MNRIDMNKKTFEDKVLESIRRKVTVDEIADVLSIQEDRAQVLFDGVVEFEASEVFLLAMSKGMSYTEFIGMEA